jgi:hypothetical protein
MSGVYDGRMPPFMWQSVGAMRVLRAEYVKANERKAAVAIYQSMTEAANDARAREFEAPRRRIAELAGCSVDTVDRYVKRFVELGLLEIRAQRQGSVNLPNVWILLEPTVSSPAPPSRTPEATPRLSDAATPSRTPEAPIEEGERQEGEKEEEEDPRATVRLFDEGAVPARRADELAALRVLEAIPRVNGSKRPSLEAVEKVHDRYPDLGMEELARELDFWARHGKGARKQIQSVMGTFATFAKKAEEDRLRRASQNGGNRVGSDQSWDREAWT